jgi:hypothetical protein
MENLDNIIWSEEIDTVFKEKGIALFDMNDNNWVFTKRNALKIINKLKEMQIPVLGGNIFIKQKDIIQSANDNWYCEIRDTPVGETFLNFSIKKSRKYISKYRNKLKGKVLFAIVPLVEYKKKIIWSEEIDAIFKEKMTPLFDMNDNYWVFTKDNALDVIEKLKKIKIPVLYGEVLIAQNNKIRITGDGWWCEKKDIPTDETYLNFSIEKSKQYILNYKISEDGIVLFTIFPMVKDNRLEIIKLVRY